MTITSSKMGKRLAAALALGASAALALTACAGNTPAPAPTDAAPTAAAGIDPMAPEQSSINVVQFQMPTAAVLFAGKEAGFLADYGLTVENSWGQSSPAIMSIILGPGGQIGTVSSAVTIDSANQGLDVVIIGEMFREVPESQVLVTLPGSDVKELADFVGKTVGVTGLNAGVHNRLRYLMQQEGIEESDVTFVDVASGEIAGALQRGEIDIASATGPALAAMKSELDATVVVDVSDGFFADFPSLQWVANGEWARANPNTVAAFQCSVVIQAANLVTEDDDAYVAAATSPEVGFTLEAVKATPKLTFPAANDAEQMQRWAAMQYAIGQTETEFDMASIVVPLPDNC